MRPAFSTSRPAAARAHGHAGDPHRKYCDPAAAGAKTASRRRLGVQQSGRVPGGRSGRTRRPPFPMRVEKSADGHFLRVIPEGFLQPGTGYTLTVESNVYTGGLPVGNLTLGGKNGADR